MTALPKTMVFENTPAPSLFKLVTRPAHKFIPDGTIPAGNGLYTLSADEERHWQCLHCGLWRITVMPANAPARREWRRPGEVRRFAEWAMPVCEVMG